MAARNTRLVIFYNGIYIYRYTFTIRQYTFIGWVYGGREAHLYQVYVRDTHPLPPGMKHNTEKKFCYFWTSQAPHMSRLMTKPKNDMSAQRRLRSAWASDQSSPQLRISGIICTKNKQVSEKQCSCRSSKVYFRWNLWLLTGNLICLEIPIKTKHIS